MSVIIKGLDMPKSCAWCPLCYDYSEHEYFCAGTDDALDITQKDLRYERPDYCPLVELPEEYSDES